LSALHDLDGRIAELVFLGTHGKIELDQLASAVRIHPKEVRRSLQRLIALGYPLRVCGDLVERGSFQPIDPQEVRTDLHSQKIGRRVEWRLHVRSTQDELKSIEQHAEDGTLVLAETQAAGRGRLTRGWFSPFGGIWMSVLLRPTWPKSYQILTLAFAAATARSISAVAGISPLLKWPNDVVVQSRKIAGILAEASYEGGKLNTLIVGLGVNANIKTTLFPRELRESATSINRELGREIDRILLARKILEEMDSAYRKFESGQGTQLLDEVRRLCSTLGRRVEVTTVEGKFKGEALNIGDDGQLIVRLGNGTTLPFYAADVVHLR